MHPRWSHDDVLDAAAAWWWAPPDADVVTGDLTLVHWPRWAPHGATVVTTASDRPPQDLLDEALAATRAWGRQHLHWWVTGATRPDMAPLLRAHGAETIETVDVLARTLDPADPAPAPPPGIDVRRAATLDDLRDLDAVDVAVWDQEPMDETRLAGALAELHTGPPPTTIRVVASLDGTPVATGGATLADPPRTGLGQVARLWGAGTLPTARGRGAYRAVLAERLRLATTAGARLALVKGRVATSAPILTRAGFTRYGTETLLRLPAGTTTGPRAPGMPA